MKLVIWQYILGKLPSEFRMKSYAIAFSTRLLSVLLGLAIYSIFRRILPAAKEYSLEISMISSIVISIVAVLPIQELIEVRLKRVLLSEYLFDDPLTVKNAQRRFEFDALISNVFPDMVKISGSYSGRIAVLNKHNGFNIYTYSRGERQKKVKKKNYQINNTLIDFLKEHKNGVSVDECLKYPEINDYFISLKANYILPFLFRDRLFGFLAVTNIPVEQDNRNLMILSSKAAMAVYNHILSSQIAEHAKYKREFEVASRIEDLIFTKKMPELENFEFFMVEDSPNILIEFLPGKEYHHFILITLGASRIGSGLVASYLLGSLYSQSLLTKKHSIKSIKNLVDETIKSLSWTDGYELLIGRFHKNSQEITFMQVGMNFKVISAADPGLNLLSVGWRNEHEIKNDELSIYYKNNQILSIKRKSD